MIFEIAYTWYEDYTPYLFEGQATEEEWKAVCNDAICRAASAMIENGIDFTKYGRGLEKDHWYGWPDIVSNAAAIIQGDCRFKLVTPIKRTYWGSNIIDGPRDNEFEESEDKFSLPEAIFLALISHNDEFRCRLDTQIDDAREYEAESK